MSRAVRGLMIKDYQLMKSQMKFFFIMVIVFGVLMSGSLNMQFFAGYIAPLCAVLLLGTFGYDEYENGFRYLFTLPVSRRDYVFEKYIFGILLTTIPGAVMNLISWLVHAVKGEETGFWQFFLMLAVSLPLAYLMLALEVPLQIKFGREKSRIVTVVLIGVMSAGMGMIGSLSEFSGIDDAAIRGGFASLGVEGISLLVAAVLAALLLLSYRISCRMMEKKEF